MDIGIILLGTIIILACVLPLVFIMKNRSKKEKEFRDVIFDMAAKSNSNIDQYDRWNNTIIGIDNSNRKLFFYRKAGGKVIQHEIDLAEIEMSSVINTQHHSKNTNNSVTQKLELALIAKGSNTNKLFLEFYNADFDSLTIMDELQLVEKWSRNVNSIISTGHPVKNK
jgi:hypothetical protein